MKRSEMWARTLALNSFLALLAVFLALPGCAAERSYRIAYAETAQAVGSAYRALDEYDEIKIRDILAMPKDEGQRELADYERRLQIAKKALAAIVGKLSVQNAASRIHQCVVGKNWECALGEVLKVGAEIAQVLSELGVKP